ncbi:hypothetical protein GmHk_04G010906 [Glycine max]|nr:hypothetical protein GmHk_04G010906 [Glycine max]
MCGEAHETGQCIPTDDNTQEIHFIRNQQRQGYNQGGFSGFQQGPYNQPIQQGPNIFQRTTKLEETLSQFMQIANKSSNNFGEITENNPNEECRAVMTRSKRFVEVGDKENVVDKEQRGEKKGVEVKKNDVKGKENQEKGKKIMVQNKEMEDQEKEKEREKEIENEKNENEKNKVVENSRSGKAMEESMEVPYLVVPSKKEKDRHLARFLDSFRKLEITMPFGEALQQMPLYSKFLKDMLPRKHK